jgi:hypothetical protein
VQDYFHRPAADRIEVYKMTRRCTYAVLNSATIDPATGEATQIVGAELQPDARRAPYARLDLDRTGRRLTGRMDLPGLQQAVEAPVETRPWHQYDYDLATLSVAFEARRGSRAPMTFGLALFSTDPAEPGKLLHWLGSATARFAAAERHLGRDTLRFEVAGPAFGKASGGPLWVDARRGFIVDVQWGRPNHDEDTNFRLRLIGEEPAGEAAWTALLRRHYAGCPASGGGTSAP